MTIVVRDLMRKNPYTVAESASIQDTARIMNDKKVSSLVILDENNNPVGLVTERDLVRKVCINDLPTNRVTNKEIMSSPLITIDSESSASTATDLMLKNNVRHLLVINNESKDNNQPIGIITPLDLVKNEEYTRDEGRKDALEMILEYYI
ncbi:MAG: CBS domain-containing protein [Nitrososphaeraceae archaeon]|nr:CBS domain-containing protein [Nitrososphaeraceae archaeon]MDW0260625.1 CBS domain-containing protein [Nitrososphaeraceae archaeon]MDW0290217.1 CBS domain-containing protein [Nitrososphaeraceae archaeon]MDW3622107.1 CBS domain-containing protein [Nitrososphaeraceae archaeon]